MNEYTETLEAIKLIYNEKRSPEEIRRFKECLDHYRKLIALITNPELLELYEGEVEKIKALLFKPKS